LAFFPLVVVLDEVFGRIKPEILKNITSGWIFAGFLKVNEDGKAI
jgi:hypothetical protein